MAAGSNSAFERRIARRLLPAGVAALLLYPSVAHAQDASVVAEVLAPPVLLAPLLVTFVRGVLVRRRAPVSLSLLRSLAVACAELGLWLGFAFFAVNMYFAERWYLPGVVVLAATLALGWLLNRRLLRGTGATSASVWASVLAFPATFVALAVATFVLLALLERVA